MFQPTLNHAILLILLIRCRVSAISGSTIDKVDCIPTPTLCTDVICDLNQSKQNPFRSNFTIGCTLTKPIGKISVRLKHYFMAPNNKQYVPGLYDTQLDFCAMVNNTDHPLLTTFLPNIEQFRTILHSCPYSGQFWFKDVTLDGSLFPGLVRKRYKCEVTFQRGKYQPYFKITFYGEFGYNHNFS